MNYCFLMHKNFFCGNENLVTILFTSVLCAQHFCRKYSNTGWCLMLSGYRKRSSNISMCSLIGTSPSLVVTLTMDYYLSKETTGDLSENCYHQYLPLASWNRCSSKTGLDWLLLIWNRIPFKIILTWLYQRY